MQNRQELNQSPQVPQVITTQLGWRFDQSTCQFHLTNTPNHIWEDVNYQFHLTNTPNHIWEDASSNALDDTSEGPLDERAITFQEAKAFIALVSKFLQQASTDVYPLLCKLKVVNAWMMGKSVARRMHIFSMCSQLTIHVGFCFLGVSYRCATMICAFQWKKFSKKSFIN